MVEIYKKATQVTLTQISRASKQRTLHITYICNCKCRCSSVHYQRLENRYLNLPRGFTFYAYYMKKRMRDDLGTC